MKNTTTKILVSLAFVAVAVIPATSNAIDPTAVATATNVTTAGGTSYSFTVRYADDGEIDTGTLDSNDVRVTGPGGFNAGAAFVGVNSHTNGTPRIATYSIVPPGGSWDVTDNGTYNVVMQANQVFDGIGNPVAAGNIGTFTVTAPPSSPAAVTTHPATSVASFSSTLNGSLDPHGLTTSVHFQYGTTTSYGLTTAPQSRSGNTYVNVTANISSLAANTTYHFRMVASNASGTTMGGDRTFITLTPSGPPVVNTNAATNVTSSSATLNGSLDPHGLNTSVGFQYGTTTSYGHTTTMQSRTGNTYRYVAANVTGLTAHSIFHCRVMATNTAGTNFGDDKTFATP